MSFDNSFARVVGIEGRYSNNPKDSGGETMFGITERVARANGYNDEMSKMPLSVAKAIYRKQYWDVLRLNDVDKLSPEIAHELFDTSVNLGVGAAGKFLQRSLNVLNREQKDYGDIPVDGVVGPTTVYALAGLIKKRSNAARVLLSMLNSLQGAFYIDLAEKRPKDEEFILGWFLNRVVV